MVVEPVSFERFSSYSPSELFSAGRAFVDFVAQRKAPFGKLGTEAWTEFVLDWWAETAAQGALVDARRARALAGRVRSVGQRASSGEFMLDLVHSTYPPYDTGYLTRAYWETALSTDLRIKLALESEWGHELRGDLSFARILEDAAKVASIRAEAKVLLFASHSANNKRMDVVAALSRLRRCTDCDSPWLWVDVPWDKSVEHCDCGLIT